MSRKSSFNLSSPNQLRRRCDLACLVDWFSNEASAIDEVAVREAALHIVRHLDSFVQFPQNSILLWQGCDRVTPMGKKQKIHFYPEQLKAKARRQGILLDTRPNGPAIASFLFAGGRRPNRFGSTNAWSIHHLYSGKFPHLGNPHSLHAQKSGNHFTQSAGLVAVHPLADALSDEFPAFAWLLRSEAFTRFGYDPDSVFSESAVNDLGFAPGRTAEIIFRD